MSQTLSVLVIEDEPLIAMMLEDFVDLLGHDLAGVADSVADALTRVDEGGFDAAILDVNLRDGACWPVADALTNAGKPFVLATGGHVEAPPPEHARTPQLAKPFTIEGVKQALETITAA
jgi:CheY-like chemotaxis protein